MIILDDFIQIKSDRKELRKFGLTVGIVLALFGTFLYFKHRPNYSIFWIISASCIIPALTFPKILWPFQKIWMGLSIVMGFIMTRVILSVLFYVTITPIGLLSKCFSKDFLDLKIDHQAKTYWNIRKIRIKDKSSYENQY